MVRWSGWLRCVEEPITLGPEHVRDDFAPVVEASVADEVPLGADGAVVSVPGAEDQTGDAGEHDGPGGHGAGLKVVTRVQLSTRQVPRACPAGCRMARISA